MAEKVTFDGPNKLIIINNGYDNIDAQVDIYSDWKEWVIQQDNSKYLPALRTVGGDPIGGGQSISGYYFLINGWRVRPYEGNHFLTVLGNLYVDEGGAPFVPTLGTYQVVVSLQVSPQSLTNTVTTTAASLTDQEKTQIAVESATKVWEQSTTSPVSGSYGELVDSIKADTSLIPATL